MSNWSLPELETWYKNIADLDYGPVVSLMSRARDAEVLLATVRAQQRTIESLNVTARDQQRTIESLRATMTSRACDAENLRATVVEQREEIRNLREQQRVSDLDPEGMARFCALRKTATDQKEEIARLKAELSNLRTSALEECRVALRSIRILGTK